MPSYSKNLKIPGLNADQIYEIVARDIEKFFAGSPVGKLEVDRDQDSKEVQVKSKMFEATLSCEDGCLAIDAKLSLLAMPFRSMLDDGLEKWVSKMKA